MQKKFCHERCMEFECSEENKLIYTTIHKEYIDTVENYIEKRLKQEITDFDMEKFASEISSRKDEIDEQILDLFESFSDFSAFKEMMLFAKAHLVATTPKLKSSKAAKLGLKDKNTKEGSGEQIDQSKLQLEQYQHYE